MIALVPVSASVAVTVPVNVYVLVPVCVPVNVHALVNVSVTVTVPVSVNVLVHAHVCVTVTVTVFVHVFVDVAVNVPVTVFERSLSMKLRFDIEFVGKYVGNPYWLEMYKVIEITKNSGVNRARSTANRRKALEEYLRSQNMTLADYEALEALSKRPFHMNDGHIVIPVDRVLAFLVATCNTARAAMKPCVPEQVRSRFLATPWVTDKTEPDGKWSRFVTVSSGTGGKLSNQRGLREDYYIEFAKTSGELEYDPQFVNTTVLQNALKWGGEFVGIGAARKMGMGRFVITRFV